MRPDMPKVIVERPRRGARFPFGLRRRAYERKTRCRDGDDAHPKSMPMRFAPSRELNENLEPLRRFLMTRCGRAWDDVYAEIRKRLAPRNAVDMHVMQHLWQFVYFARREPSGRIVLVDEVGASRLELLPDRRVLGVRPYRGLFYVCCDTRRLVFVPSHCTTRRGASRVYV